jgi:EAL domain-containing protein (putative c-di-GMP-specific phosphodiesterase class I)
MRGAQACMTPQFPASGPAMTPQPRSFHSEPLHQSELQEALTGAQIHAVYQPIVRISDRRPVGLEALARLHHPAHGILSPGLFVPPMEQAGLARALTEAVVRRAFADWGGDLLPSLDLTLSLNFSLDVLLLPEALRWLEAQRRQAGIPAARLIIELTESQPVSHLPELAEAATWLRDLGYGLAIDDVGPQIRDHGPLLGLPFSMLKLDMGVVRDTAVNRAARQFLTHAIAEAHGARLLVTAEGVEDEACWSRMQQMGVELAQGFLVGRPLSAEGVLAWHRSWNTQYPQ